MDDAERGKIEKEIAMLDGVLQGTGIGLITTVCGAVGPSEAPRWLVDQN